jgi:putative copper resistance protein D
MSAPDLWTLAWHAWEPPSGLDIAAAAAAAVYLIGARRVARGWPWRYTLSFLAGIGCVLVAVQSGIDAYDDQLLSDHMIQHLFLLELAPLLLLTGRPGILLLRAMPPSRRPALARRLMKLRPFTHPLSCLTIFYVIVFGIHVPAFFDATLRQPLLHDLEHLLFLVAGLLMWWPLVDADPLPHARLDGLGRLVYVIAAMVPMTVIGAYLNRASSLVYTGYALPAHSLGISAIVDQQRAGAIMWVLGSSLMVGSGIWHAMAALSAEERRLQTRERRAAADAVARERQL